jgi:branched-chain amino acid transport system ATP-binding protein
MFSPPIWDTVMIKLTELTAGYGGRPIVSGINLTVARGETVAVLGADTAGKTTLIKAIAGLLPSISGSIEFAGQEILSLPAYSELPSVSPSCPRGVTFSRT